MGFHVRQDQVGRPVEDLLRAYELVTAKLREHRELYGPHAPETDDVERFHGMFATFAWLGGDPVGPFSDGAVSPDRLWVETRNASEVIRGRRQSRLTPLQALGVRQMCQYARGAVDELPGITDGQPPAAAAA